MFLEIIKNNILIISILINFIVMIFFTFYLLYKKRKYKVKFSKISGLFVYICSVILIDLSLVLSYHRIYRSTMIKLSVAPAILIIPVLFLTKILSEIIAKEQVDLQYEFLVR